MISSVTPPSRLQNAYVHFGFERHDSVTTSKRLHLLCFRTPRLRTTPKCLRLLKNRTSPLRHAFKSFAFTMFSSVTIPSRLQNVFVYYGLNCQDSVTTPKQLHLQWFRSSRTRPDCKMLKFTSASNITTPSRHQNVCVYKCFRLSRVRHRSKTITFTLVSNVTTPS